MMKRDLDRCIKTHFDVLVIGGGINGAAIAHMAALNGLKTCLLEKQDFASGTSSKSTKIVHGGLRYLENFEFSLVKEALKERTIQLRNVPHLIKPLGFIIPIYKNDGRPLWFMKLGVFVYDLLSGKYRIKKRRSLNAAEIEHLVPGIKSEGLTGGIMYYDGQMDDARLVLENVLSAREKGACVLNYAEVVAPIKQLGKTIGVQVRDAISGKEFPIKAKKIVAAVGPWTDIFLRKENAQAPQKVRTTKGIHIVYRGQVAEHALLIPIKKDHRVFFVIPWHGNSLIGTTDTDYSGDPDKVNAEEEDIEYLFTEARRIFPSVDFKKEDIITTFAGLRPLVFEEGHPSKLSREHTIDQSYSGITYVYGGKYTTYRKIADEVLKTLMTRPPIDAGEHYPLYGSGEINVSVADVAKEAGLDPKIVERLMNMYGSRYVDVLKLTEENPRLKELIVPGPPFIKAQIVYAIRTEMAQKAEDILERRLGLIYEDCDLAQCRHVIEEFLKPA